MKKLIKRASLTVMTLGLLYGSLAVAHAQIAHDCPKAKVNKQLKGKVCHHPKFGEDSQLYPASCICWMDCFFGGLGLPMPDFAVME